MENMDVDISMAINNLKELIEQKFADLEKRLQLRDENSRLRFENLETKDRQHDAIIHTLERKLDEIEKKEADKYTRFFNGIKGQIISWLVPVLLLALIYAFTHGFTPGGK